MATMLMSTNPELAGRIIDLDRAGDFMFQTFGIEGGKIEVGGADTGGNRVGNEPFLAGGTARMPSRIP